VDALAARRARTTRGVIEVADVGSGPAVLVVHGAPGSWRQAISVSEDLAGEARVLLVSRPGYGRTPLRSGRSPQEQGELYVALLNALGIDRAVVLGISGGGPSAYALTVAHPDRVVGLLLCCAVTPHLMELPTSMLRLAAVPGLWRGLAAVSRFVHRMRPPPLDLTGLTPVEQELAPEVLTDIQRFETDRHQSLSGVGLRNDTRQLSAAREIPWPSGAVVPTIVLHGDTDDVVPLLHAEAYATAVPGAVLEVLNGYGHAVPLFARARVAALLRQLIRGAPDPPTLGTATPQAAPPP
jgi:2-hydroxy-6-oxonona-2,4-dienedioate hydrolase